MTFTPIKSFISKDDRSQHLPEYPRSRGHNHVPVRGHSVCIGRYEHTFWKPMTKKRGFRILTEAEIFERKSRAKGQRCGKLGHVALEVLKLMVNICDPRTGRLEPSLVYMMGRLTRSKQAIVRALANLRECGFLEWIRRYRPVEQEGPGPQIRQTSNAYKMMMPRALEKVAQHKETIPLPDDVPTAQERTQAVQDMLEVLPPKDQIDITLDDIEDDSFAKALKTFAQNVLNKSSEM